MNAIHDLFVESLLKMGRIPFLVQMCFSRGFATQKNWSRARHIPYSVLHSGPVSPWVIVDACVLFIHCLASKSKPEQTIFLRPLSSLMHECKNLYIAITMGTAARKSQEKHWAEWTFLWNPNELLIFYEEKNTNENKWQRVTGQGIFCKW